MKNLLKNNYFLIVFTLIAFPIYSQLIEIEGVVSENQSKETIPYATVILKNSDNDFLVGTTTDENGQYLLKYKKGNYNIEYSFIGYETQNIAIELNKKLTKNIELSLETFNIDEVTIVAETTTVKQLIDKKVIHVGKDILSSGGSAATVLSQLSEVDADEDGSISLRGNSNVQVLVNGKPSPLSSAELLVQISASEIKTIEIITSPSAKHKADGLTGIINIITKKKVKKGITNNNSVGYNSFNEFSGNSSLSYGAKKINYKIGAFYRKNRSNSERKKERFGNSPYSEESTNKYQGNVYKVNAGLDWFVNKQNEFSWSVSYSNNKHHTNTEKTIVQDNIMSFQDNLSSHIHRSLKLNGNYRHIFTNEENFIELDVDLHKNNNILKGYFNPNITVFDNLVDNEILTSNIALDNAIALNKKVKLESGYLWYLQELDNKRTLFDAINGNPKDLYTTRLSTHALYTQVSYETEKLGVQIGLRGEFYNRKATFITDNTNVDNTFTDLFPSVHFKYTPNDINTFGIGYNRRTYRPRLYQINPISSQSDEFTFREGNPNLKPEFSNNLDLTYQIKKGKLSISNTLSYQSVASIILQNQKVNTNGVQIRSFINGGSSNNYGLEFSANYKPTKWLKSNFNINWNYEDIENSTTEEFPMDFSRSYQFTFKNSFKINKNMDANIAWRYRGSSVDFYGERDKTQKVDIGFKHKIFKTKGSLSLRFTDIFDTYLYKGVEFGDDFSRNYQSKRESRAVHISLSYKFSKGKIEKRKKKKRDY